jgi:hypothetical protein
VVRKQVPEWARRIDLDRFWRVAAPVAAVALAVDGLLLASTFLPGDPPLPDGLAYALFCIMFPVHIGTVLSMIQVGDGRRTPLRHTVLFGALSRAERAVLSGIVGACALLAALSFLGSDGQAEQHDGRYYLSDHGTLTEVSHEEYAEQRKLGQRASIAIPAVFCAVGVGVGIGYRRRARQAPPLPDPQPGSPLPTGPGSSTSAPWPEPRFPADLGDPPAPWPPA